MNEDLNAIDTVSRRPFKRTTKHSSLRTTLNESVNLVAEIDLCHLCKWNIGSSEDSIILVFQLTLPVSLCLAWLHNHWLSFSSWSSAITQLWVDTIFVNHTILTSACNTLIKIMANNDKCGEWLNYRSDGKGMESSQSYSTSNTSSWKEMSTNPTDAKEVYRIRWITCYTRTHSIPPPINAHGEK